MKKVQAAKVEIQVCYYCPKCEWAEWLTPKQYTASNFFVTCGYCGTQYKPIPPTSQSNRLSKQTKTIAKPKTPTAKTTKRAEHHTAHAIKLLKAQGFDPRELQTIINDHNISGDLDEVVSQILERL